MYDPFRDFAEQIMKMLYHMGCSERGRSASLYQLKDGRFQIVNQGKIKSLMVDSGYALVEEEFAEYLKSLDFPGLVVVDAIIYDPKDKVEMRTHRQLQIGQCFSAAMISAIDLNGERMLLMDNSYIFVTPLLKRQIESSKFQYLRFSVGLSEFAS